MPVSCSSKVVCGVEKEIAMFDRGYQLTNHKKVLVKQWADFNVFEVAGMLRSGIVQRCLALGTVVL